MTNHLDIAISKFGSVQALATALGVTSPTICSWRKGNRPVPPKRCVQLEQLTDGLIQRKNLRSDWALIWPELLTKE